jgi:hypothetical protein
MVAPLMPGVGEQSGCIAVIMQLLHNLWEGAQNEHCRPFENRELDEIDSAK